MTTPTLPLDGLMHCAKCGGAMTTTKSPNHSYRCANGCETAIDAPSANHTLIQQIMQDIMSDELAAELRETVESQLADAIRQEMPGVKPPTVSAEWIRQYGTDPDTYVGGDPETACELMTILIERIDAQDQSAVITYRFTSLLDNPTVGTCRQTVNLHPNSQMEPSKQLAKSERR